MSSIACLPVLTYHYKLQINLPRDYKKGYLLSYTRNIRQFLSLTFGKEHTVISLKIYKLKICMSSKVKKNVSSEGK